MNEFQRDLAEDKVVKWLYILLYGSIVFGGITAFVSAFVIELSYHSFKLSQDFWDAFILRYVTSLFIFLISGAFLGHWLWTYKDKKELLNENNF